MSTEIKAGDRVAEMNHDLNTGRSYVRAVGVVREIYPTGTYFGNPSPEARITWFKGYAGTGCGWPTEQLVKL